jgi:hypothetical protein
MERSGRRLQEAEDNPWSRPTQSTLYPADPTLVGDGTLPSVSSSQKICVACSIETWEKARRTSGKKTYKLSLKEQKKGSSFLRCQSCGSHVCNLCAALFCAKVKSLRADDGEDQVVSSWCQLVRQFLSQSQIEKRGFVQEISSQFCFLVNTKKHQTLC